MITKEDLIGEWVIIKNNLKDISDGKQEEMDKINSKYLLTFREDNSYSEVNNGILYARLSNFEGSYKVENNHIILHMRMFKLNRTYIVSSFNSEIKTMSITPCDTLYCSIYRNIDSIILQKK